MYKVFFLIFIFGLLFCTTRANEAKESECREELERELQEYVKLDTWQQIFRRHLKFIVNKNGEILNKRKRLKFNTIIHNAIYGCDHELDDEADYCPNIYQGSVKSCNHGKNLRSAMFRAARCVFVESSVRHVVLSDALLDAYPSDKLDKIPDYGNNAIREFGEVVSNMLSILVHGERGGLGELMALNLYLNNRYGTVFMFKVPVENVTSPVDMEIAQRHMRSVHKMILEKQYTFWDTWCSDRDVVTQYRVKHKNEKFIVVLDEMNKNINEANDLIRGLNVSGNVVDLDFDPKSLALTDFVDGIISSRSMPDALLANLRLQSFELSYNFNPRAMYEFHESVFRNIYYCFYWTTITHFKLSIHIMDEIQRQQTVENYRNIFILNFVRYVRALTVFNMNRYLFVTRLSPKASRNLSKLDSFLLKTYYDSKNTDIEHVILSLRPEIEKFVDALNTDMKTMFDIKFPADYLREENALKLMQSNYRAFARLVSATSDFKKDRGNAIKLKESFLLLSEAVEFAGNY